MTFEDIIRQSVARVKAENKCKVVCIYVGQQEFFHLTLRDYRTLTLRLIRGWQHDRPKIPAGRHFHTLQ
jgi:hypothetical protein